MTVKSRELPPARNSVTKVESKVLVKYSTYHAYLPLVRDKLPRKPRIVILD